MADGDDRSGGAGDAGSVALAQMTHVIGTLVGFDPQRGPLVTYPGAREPLLAATTVALNADIVQAAITRGGGVVLAFDRGRADSPIVVGLLQAPGDAPVVAHVDGERVVIEGNDEIVLRCGAASITLRRNGRVVIRGTAVETRASGVNRIRGGSVQIN